GARSVQGRGTVEPLRVAALFGSFVVGTAQPQNTPNSTRQIFSIDTRTGRYASSPAGLIDANGTTEGIAQISASADGRYAVASIQTTYGPPVPVNRVEIFDRRRHRDLGHLARPAAGDLPDRCRAPVPHFGRRAHAHRPRRP